MLLFQDKLQVGFKVICDGPIEHVRAAWLDTGLRSAPWLFQRTVPLTALKEVVPEKKLEGDAISGPVAAARLLASTRDMVQYALKMMKFTPSASEPALSLAIRYCLQATGVNFSALRDLLALIVEKMPEQPDVLLTAAEDVLQMIKANVRRLVVSRIMPMDAGVQVLDPESSDALNPKGPFIPSYALVEPVVLLQPLKSLLHQIQAGLLPNQATLAAALSESALSRLQSVASDTIDTGLQLFFPTEDAVTELLRDRLGAGGVVEVHFPWPAPAPAVRTYIGCPHSPGHMNIMRPPACPLPITRSDLHNSLGCFMVCVLFFCMGRVVKIPSRAPTETGGLSALRCCLWVICSGWVCIAAWSVGGMCPCTCWRTSAMQRNSIGFCSRASRSVSKLYESPLVGAMGYTVAVTQVALAADLCARPKRVPWVRR